MRESSFSCKSWKKEMVCGGGKPLFATAWGGCEGDAHRVAGGADVGRARPPVGKWIVLPVEIGLTAAPTASAVGFTRNGDPGPRVALCACN